VEHTNSWHTHGSQKLQNCTKIHAHVTSAFTAPARPITTTRHLIQETWTQYHWNTHHP